MNKLNLCTSIWAKIKMTRLALIFTIFATNCITACSTGKTPPSHSNTNVNSNTDDTKNSSKNSTRIPAGEIIDQSSLNEIYENSTEDDSRIVHEYQEQQHRQFIDWPVDYARMTRGYLPFKKKPHLGIDLAAPKGTPILAAHDGVVVYAGRDFRGFGKMVLIEGAYGWASLYAHFTTINVKTGDRVSQGQKLGGMGRTGRATGVHLHFELRKKKGPVDPLLYLPAADALTTRHANYNTKSSPIPGSKLSAKAELKKQNTSHE